MGYEAAEGAEDFSAVVEDTIRKSKVLKVDTDGTPLTRGFGNYNTSSKSVYIDTMVKFTVTPEGDEPDPATDDKLPIRSRLSTSAATPATQ